MKLILLVTCSLIISCASSTKSTSDKSSEIRNSEYTKLIEDNTQKDRQYSGFYNTFQAAVTQLNSKVQNAYLDRLSHFKQWDTSKKSKEREKYFQENASQAKYLVSFFTPERQHNDLDKGNSMWQIYLEYNGTKYPGKATKKNLQLIQLQALLPHHNRWSKVYEVTFNVPMNSVETGSSVLVITSSLGNSKLSFKPID